MEYDLSKAPHENVLLEQKVVSKLTDNQQLAKMAGYGDVTPQRADELAKAGLLIYAAKMAPMWLFKPDELLTDEERKKKEEWLINQEMKSMPNYTEVGPLPDRYNSIYDSPSEISGWDHDIAGYTELGLTGLGALLIASGYLAPVGVGLLAAGTSVGIADALHYFKEGKDFDEIDPNYTNLSLTDKQQLEKEYQNFVNSILFPPSQPNPIISWDSRKLAHKTQSKNEDLTINY